jgi:hypothetical protein
MVTLLVNRIGDGTYDDPYRASGVHGIGHVLKEEIGGLLVIECADGALVAEAVDISDTEKLPTAADKGRIVAMGGNAGLSSATTWAEVLTALKNSRGNR